MTDNFSRLSGVVAMQEPQSADAFTSLFFLGDFDTNSVTGPFRYFDGGKLYCIIDPDRIGRFSDLFMDKIADKSLIDSAKEADCHIIAELSLR